MPLWVIHYKLSSVKEKGYANLGGAAVQLPTVLKLLTYME